MADKIVSPQSRLPISDNRPPSPQTDEQLPFRAFISYSTDPDYRLSQRVESFIETFHRLRTPPGITLKAVQVCRDGSDFSIQRALKEASSSTEGGIENLIESYLAESEYLVVLCSSQTPRSRYVGFEIDWFLKNKGWECVLLAVTEGKDPATNPGEVFPQAVIEAGLHRKPFYDFRGFKGRAARDWIKVRDSEEELANLAALLHEGTSGRLMPIWQREAVRKARKQRMVFAGAAIVFAAIAGVAFWQRSLATKARDRAERALEESNARQLVLFAEANIEKDPQLSLLLAMEASRQAKRSGTTDTESEGSILRRAVLATPRRLGSEIAGIECFAIHPDGESIVLGTQHSGVLELSLKDGAVLRQYPSSGWVDTVDWSPDGSLLAAGTRDYLAFIWDAKNGQMLANLKFEAQPQSVHWRANTRQLAIGLAMGDASKTKVYDYDSKRELFEVTGMTAAWSPNGKLLAAAGIDGSVHIYSESGQELAALHGHDRYVSRIVWHPDGRLLATASVDNYVMVWDSQEHKQVARLENEFALSAAWSLDGRALASGAGTRFVKVWETGSFAEIFKLTQSQTITGEPVSGSGAAGYVLDVAWGANGKTLVVSDREGGILVFAASLLHAKTDDEWLATAREQVQRGFTREEVKKFRLASNGGVSEIRD